MVGGRRRRDYSKNEIKEAAFLLLEKFKANEAISCMTSMWCSIFKPQVIGRNNEETIILQRFLWFEMANVLQLSGNELFDMIRFNRENCQNIVQSCPLIKST